MGGTSEVLEISTAKPSPGVRVVEMQTFQGATTTSRASVGRPARPPTRLDVKAGQMRNRCPVVWGSNLRCLRDRLPCGFSCSVPSCAGRKFPLTPRDPPLDVPRSSGLLLGVREVQRARTVRVARRGTMNPFSPPILVPASAALLLRAPVWTL